MKMSLISLILLFSVSGFAYNFPCNEDRARWEAEAFLKLQYNEEAVFITSQTKETEGHVFQFVAAYTYKGRVDGYKGVVTIPLENDGTCADPNFGAQSLYPLQPDPSYDFNKYLDDISRATPKK